MTKKFRVSLAFLKQCNYEIEIAAENEHEAITKAIADYEDGEGNGEIVEFDSAEFQPDFDFNEEDGGESTGIFCSEVENGN